MVDEIETLLALRELEYVFRRDVEVVHKALEPGVLSLSISLMKEERAVEEGFTSTPCSWTNPFRSLVLG